MNSGGIRIGKLSPQVARDVAQTTLPAKREYQKLLRNCESWRAGGTEVPRRLKSAPRGAGFILRRASARLCRYEEEER